jgi:DNA-directed RNA polymerase III subunit RPC2
MKINQSSISEMQHNFPGMGSLFESGSLNAPIKDVKDKDTLIPAFLSLKPLVKQHIDSFNHLLNVDIQKIITSKHNRRITSDVDPTFYLQYN